MSSSYVLSPPAQADLSDIWDYSYGQWGADQADAYVLAIHAACAINNVFKRSKPVPSVKSCA